MPTAKGNNTATASRFRGASLWVIVPGLALLLAGAWLLAAGCWLVFSGRWWLGDSSRAIEPGCWQLDFSGSLLTDFSCRMILGCWLLAAGFWFLFVREPRQQ